MTAELLIEQFLNGLQFGFMLFLMSAGLTLIFGVMGLINLAHGSLYMIGAFSAAATFAFFNSFWFSLLASFSCAAIVGIIVEKTIIRKLYNRDHLDQVLVTFALILFFSELVRWIFGAFPLYLDVPELLNGSIEVFSGIYYSKYRLFIIFVGLIIAVFLFFLIGKTNLGIQIRAGQHDREMISALGVDISKLYTLLFGIGAALAGLAGALIGSIKGAVIASLLVGVVDTLGRFLIPWVLQTVTNPSDAMSVGSAIGSMLIYILMAIILILKPTGLYGKQLS